MLTSVRPVTVAMVLLCELAWDGVPRAHAQAQAIPSPAPRYGHRAVWDAARAMMIVFGGRIADKSSLGDTWGWDGTSWHRLATDGPTPRAWVGMAYDDRHATVVLFGGRDAEQRATGDTWLWGGGRWQMAAAESSSGPAPRDHAAMAYDPERQRVVLHGGVRDGEILNDLWEWDGVRWTRSDADNPGNRVAHALAWDPGAKRLVLFGGRVPVANGANPVVPEETWVRDGTRWRRLQITAEGRSHTALAWDPVCRCLFRFGGGDQPRAPRNETSRLQANGWQDVAVSGPTARVDHVTVYDPARNTAWLFGGYVPSDGGAVFGDVWAWNGEAWRCVSACR